MELDSAVDGFRKSLRAGEWPSPSPLVVTTPVFDANVGKLGQLRDLDLVDQIVETYFHVKEAKECARRLHERKQNELADFNDMHQAAAFAQLVVMKLHNRLLGHISPVNQTASEAETRQWIAELPQPPTPADVVRLRAYKWN